MSARMLAWLLVGLSVVMLIVVAMRVNRGWPAGPKTYAFIVATVVVIIAAIAAWRRRDGRPNDSSIAP